MNRMTRILFEEIDAYSGRGKPRGSVTVEDVCSWLQCDDAPDYKQDDIAQACHNVKMAMRANADGRISLAMFQDFFDQQWLKGIYDVTYDKTQDEDMFDIWLYIQPLRRRALDRL